MEMSNSKINSLSASSAEESSIINTDSDLDELTGLYTETAFSHSVDRYISRIEDGHHYAFIHIDMDRYLTLSVKMENPYSHDLLKSIGLTLRTLFHNYGICCHIRDDEFAVLIKTSPPEDILSEHLRILCQALIHEYSNNAEKIRITASIGVIVSNDIKMQYSQLSKYSMLAIHESKSRGGNTYTYYSDKHEVPDPTRGASEKPSPNAPRTKKGHHVFVRTFGYFEVFLDGEPINFSSKKSKELFALMIDRRGGFISSSEAITYLWDDASNDKTLLARYRKVAMRLREILHSNDIEDIVESSSGYRRVVASKIECDYYNYLTGDVQFQNLFLGSYMTNYGWAEETLGELWSLFGSGKG